MQVTTVLDERPIEARPVEVGDVFVNTWGYDQTNVDYFQVVATTKKSVKLRAIGAYRVEGSEGFMADRVVPALDQFLNDEIVTKFPYAYSWRGGEAEWHVKFRHGGSKHLRRDAAADASTYRSWYA